MCFFKNFFYLNQMLINSLQLITVVFNNTYSQITHYFFFFLNPFRRLFSAVDYSIFHDPYLKDLGQQDGVCGIELK